MDIKHIIRTSFISLLTLGMIGGTLNGNIANAKHRHYRYYHVIRRHARRHHARRRHRARRRVRYVRASRVHGHGLHVGGYGYTLDDYSDKEDFLVHYNGGPITSTPLSHHNYTTSAIAGYRVKIIGAKRAHGHLFYKIISDPTEGNNEDDGWIYSGVLGTNPHQKSHLIFIPSPHYINTGNSEENTWYNANPNGGNTDDSSSNSSSYIPSHQNHQEKSTEYWTLQDINNAREQQGLSSLSETSDMQQIAAMRGNQLTKTGVTTAQATHDDPNTGEAYFKEDANQLGYSLGDERGENADESNYISISGRKIAKQSVNSMLYNDADSDWGHRENILNPDYNYVGINAHKDTNQGLMYIDEVFSS